MATPDTALASDCELITDSLHQLSAMTEDIVPAIYQTYFHDCPESEELMAHTDQYMRERMLTEVFQMLMAPPSSDQALGLEFEVNSHKAYGVLPHMYRNLLTAVTTTVKQQLYDHWLPEVEAAWQRRVSLLLVHIEAHCSDGETC